MSIQQHHHQKKFLIVFRSSIHGVSPTSSHAQRAFIRTSCTWWTGPFTPPRKEREQNYIFNFDQDSSDVWKSINITHRYKRSQAQYDISVLVADEVVDIIESITDHYGQFANPQTRLNGLSTLRKIGKTIALSTNDTLGREVQERFQSDACLVNGMMEIINFMTADEVQLIIEHKSSP